MQANTHLVNAARAVVHGGKSPENKLLQTASIVRFVSAEKSDGSVPEKELFDKSRLRSETSEKSGAGSGAVRLLSRKTNDCIKVKAPMAVGIVPVSLFPPMFRYLRMQSGEKVVQTQSLRLLVKLPQKRSQQNTGPRLRKQVETIASQLLLA